MQKCMLFQNLFNSYPDLLKWKYLEDKQIYSWSICLIFFT